MFSEPTEYNGYKIYHYGNSFGSTFIFGRGQYYLLDSFHVTDDHGKAYTFMFALNSFHAALHDFHADIDALTDQALETIKTRLDSGDLAVLAEYTYQYDLDGSVGRFKEVTDPVWRLKEPI